MVVKVRKQIVNKAFNLHHCHAVKSMASLNEYKFSEKMLQIILFKEPRHSLTHLRWNYFPNFLNSVHV